MKSSHRHLAVSNGITGVGRRPREETDGWVGWGWGGGGQTPPGHTLSRHHAKIALITLITLLLLLLY